MIALCLDKLGPLTGISYGVSSQNDGNHFRSITNKQTKIYEYLIHFDISSKCWNLKRYNNIYYFGDGVAATW